MFENVQCKDCPAHKHKQHKCLPGLGNLSTGPRLLVLLDYPTFIEDRTGKPMNSEGARLVRWMLFRMGLTKDQFYLEYIIKCNPPGGKMPAKKEERLSMAHACSKYRHATVQMGMFPVVVTMGRMAAEVMIGTDKLDNVAGTNWPCIEPITAAFSPMVWVGPNANALVMSPGITGEASRVLWRAAEAAGYKPHTTEIPVFDWSEFIK